MLLILQQMHQVPDVLSVTSCVMLRWLVRGIVVKDKDSSESYLGRSLIQGISCTSIYCRGSWFHSQLYSSYNYWSSLNKLHSSIWTLTCFLLVCLVKLPRNWPSRVRSYKQTLTAECVFSSAFTLTQSLCFLEEETLSTSAQYTPPPLQ